MKIIIKILPLLLGLSLIAYSIVMSTRPIAIFSDFKAFQSRVAADEKAAHALHYGGERETEDFDALTEKVLAMHFAWRPVGIIGLLIVLSQIFQINADRKNEKSNNRLQAIDAKASQPDP